MNFRAIRVIVFASLIILLLAFIYPYDVPQESFYKTIPLYEQEILLGENVSIISYSYDGNNLKVDYSFDGENYTTGEVRGDFIHPLYIREDRNTNGRVVDVYFNDSRYSPFQFYIDQKSQNGSPTISFVKGACNKESFYYKINNMENGEYGEFGYEANCQLLPGKAIITYNPRDIDRIFAIALLSAILTFFYWVFDFRYL